MSAGVFVIVCLAVGVAAIGLLGAFVAWHRSRHPRDLDPTVSCQAVVRTMRLTTRGGSEGEDRYTLTLDLTDPLLQTAVTAKARVWESDLARRPIAEGDTIPVLFNRATPDRSTVDWSAP